MSMKQLVALAVIALALGAACGTRTTLRTADAAPFVDDDLWLRLDAGPDAGVRDAPTERRDGPDAR
jgi:hypothetical protein